MALRIVYRHHPLLYDSYSTLASPVIGVLSCGLSFRCTHMAKSAPLHTDRFSYQVPLL